MLKKLVYLFLCACYADAISQENDVGLVSSNLPIIIINTGGNAIQDDPKITADISIIDNGPGMQNHPEDPPNPQDAYARSKLAAEQALFDAAKDSTMSAIALRLPLVYGRNAKGNFARLVQAVVSGRRLPLASVRNHRSLLYLGNLVEAMEAAIAAPVLQSGVHFVADAEAVSTPDLVRAIAGAWKVKARLFAVPVPMLRIAGLAAGRSVVVARLTDSLEVDTSSFREATRWSPRWSLDAGLSRTAAQHRAAPLF